jgi:hypothetical protein
MEIINQEKKGEIYFDSKKVRDRQKCNSNLEVIPESKTSKPEG